MARLATVTPGNGPHVVPVVFAVVGDLVYTAVDGKKKSGHNLRRLANIEADPRVSLLVDHYRDDWTQLWWVRADGVAAIHRGGEQMRIGYAQLRAKYPQYQTVPLDGPVLSITVSRWTSWLA